MALAKSQEEAQRQGMVGNQAVVSGSCTGPQSRYVDKHGLDRLVTKMMNAVLQEKPQETELCTPLLDGLSADQQ